MKIEYGFSSTPFGDIIVARTWDGICDLQFLSYNRMDVIHELGTRWGLYTETTQSDTMARTVSKVLFEGYQHELRLDVWGTDFQKKVWHALRDIPFGTTVTYSEVAEAIGQPKAVRSVATAIAQNPVALLIPCHRVVHKDGSIGNYHWGTARKQRLLDWEKHELQQRH